MGNFRLPQKVDGRVTAQDGRCILLRMSPQIFALRWKATSESGTFVDFFFSRGFQAMASFVNVEPS